MLRADVGRAGGACGQPGARAGTVPAGRVGAAWQLQCIARLAGGALRLRLVPSRFQCLQNMPMQAQLKCAHT